MDTVKLLHKESIPILDQYTDVYVQVDVTKIIDRDSLIALFTEFHNGASECDEEASILSDLGYQGRLVHSNGLYLDIVIDNNTAYVIFPMKKKNLELNIPHMHDIAAQYLKSVALVPFNKIHLDFVEGRYDDLDSAACADATYQFVMKSWGNTDPDNQRLNEANADKINVPMFAIYTIHKSNEHDSVVFDVTVTRTDGDLFVKSRQR